MIGARSGKPISLGITAGLLACLIMGGVAGSIRAAEFEEIIVKFEVPKLINKDIVAQFDGANIYIPVIEIFGLLEINLDANFEKGRIEGEFLRSDNKLEINISDRKIRCFGKMTDLENSDFYLGDREIFLKIDLFQKIFNLMMYFNFSELKVYLPLDREFPAYLRMKRRAAHDKLKEERLLSRDIYEIPYKRETLKGGVADWSLTVSPIKNAGQYFSLGLGGMVFGGDIEVNGSVNSISGFDPGQLLYRWHYFIDNSRYFTQLELGEINSSGSLNRNLKGVLLTNRPQIQRKYFQTINVSGNAGEGWEVELYVNNRLTDYAYTDQKGDYHFLTDVYYGSSRVLLKMYGPDGEVRTEEQYIRVPFNLIPKGSLEYEVAGGSMTTRNGDKNYAQANTYYGLFTSLTMGVNADVPLNPEEGEEMIMAGDLTYQLLGNLLLNGSFSPDNKTEYSLNYSNPELVNINFGYIDYSENDFWNALNQKNNISLSISSPLKVRKSYLGLRYRLSIDNYDTYKITNMNYGLKLPLYKMHLNYLGNYKISKYMTRSEKDLNSQLFFSTAFVKWLRPQFKIDYSHTANQITKYGIYFQKRVFKTGQLALSYEHNALTGNGMVMISFNIFNGFANLTSRANITPTQTIVTQSQRGSVRFDQETGSFRFDRRNGVGQGTAVVWPFLDENYNGLHDIGEPFLTELKASIGGARAVRGGKENIYYYDGLKPYDDYVVKIDQYSLDNPMLRPAHENFRVTINPNTVTSINVPIVTAGEITGKVERVVQGETVGVGGIRIMVINEVTGKEDNITTFNDGEYFHLGLVPGMYKAFIDPDQLTKYGYVSDPPSLSFQIKTIEGGDSVDNLNFIIRPEN
nr:hypothetical protein [candidate division Zixibacteria bacterium]